ncbi:hypothetical protein [Xenorhabdus bovienii]|uniref:Putative tail fiber protein n=1 Tax=Xenorhabdus bovienii TaxID=40576 RepID=A0A0B6X603_XENBV|nr:Putative tail fiber protein [Xenorhabdus bovienii]
MSIINKPDYKIFANDAKTGELETFPDLLRGWGVTVDRTAGKPPMEWFNALGKRTDEWMMYLSQRGLSEWDAAIDYPQYAVVQYAGKFYTAKKQTNGQRPDQSQNEWMLFADAIGIAKSIADALNAVTDNANTRLEKSKNGADIPNKPKFVDNLGLTGTVDLAKNAVPKSAITQHSGNSADHVMSQNTVTNFLNGKFDKSGGQIKTDDKFLSLQNQTTGAANYIEATDSVGNVRYRLGCMHSNSELKIENIAGKTILSIRDSAIYVNGNKVATEPAMEARYASKFRWLHSREIELTKGRYPELLDGEVMTMVRGSVNDAYFEARNARLSFLQCLIDNQWVTAKNA